VVAALQEQACPFGDDDRVVDEEVRADACSEEDGGG